MPEMASLTTITRNSLQAFWKHRPLWWFTVPAGMFVGLSTFVSNTVQDRIPDASKIPSWSSLLDDHRLLLAVGASLLLVLCQSAIRGALIALFIHRMNTVSGIRVSNRKLPWSDVIRAIRASVSFEAAYWLVLIGIGVIITIPSFLAQRFNPSILPAVFELGFLLLITIGVYLYFIKELACLYAILGKTGFRSAVDLGFRLFRRQAFNTVLFFFYAALLALFFGLLVEFSLRIVHIPIEQHSLFWSLFTAIPFGFYFIFDQILRVSFFRSIATTPKNPAIKETILEASQTPSGILPS